MAKFILHWDNGEDVVVEGFNIAEACGNAGYSGEDMRELKTYERMEE